MLAVSVIALSTIVGFVGGPVWAATACGLALAMIGILERLPSLRGAYAIGGATMAISVSTSLVLAQTASVGTFVVGRLLGGLLFA